MLGASRILEKGPEYLRRQMEREATGRVSAAERLAATKPQYVKSPQLVGSTQESLIGIGSNSVSSHGSSKRSANIINNKAVDAVNERPQKEDNMVKRNSSKKRPDSILIYRQRCEQQKESSSGSGKRNLARRLLLNSVKERPNPLPRADCKEIRPEQNRNRGGHTGQEALASRTNTVPAETECVIRRRVSRSHSDVSSRYSKNFANFDSFFKYCGLEDDVVHCMGKDNFSVQSDPFCGPVRSTSVATSEDGFSRASGGSDGLQEDELYEASRQGSSVVERNARIIKWLYSCKNATQSGKALRDLH